MMSEEAQYWCDKYKALLASKTSVVVDEVKLDALVHDLISDTDRAVRQSHNGAQHGEYETVNRALLKRALADGLVTVNVTESTEFFDWFSNAVRNGMLYKADAIVAAMSWDAAVRRQGRLHDV